MECSRCCLQPVIYAFTQANLDNSLGRMKTKEIIAAVNNLKVVFRSACGKCQNLPLQTPSKIEELKAEWEPKIDSLMASISDDETEVKNLIEEVRNAFQIVCLTCSQVSNDDNPSNHGQSFVSLDSGNCQSGAGRAKTTHTDDNIVLSRADWIGMHRAPEIDASSYGVSPDIALIKKEEPDAFEDSENKTASLLPPEIEDRLRKEFSNFVALDIIDKLLLSCLLSGMNIAEFAKMLWFPYSIVDPKTRIVKSITKQAAHARWINVCKKFPTFIAVAASSARDKKAKEKLRSFILNPNGEKDSNRFQNGKLLPTVVKEEKRQQEALDKKREAKIAKLEKEVMSLKSRNESLKKSLDKAKSKPEEPKKHKPTKRDLIENSIPMFPDLFGAAI